MENGQSPQLFTLETDTVTAAVAAIAPNMKFLGLGMGQGPPMEWFEYFLNAS